MKRLMYTIALSLAFVSVTSASRAIASSPFEQLPAIRQINLVSQTRQSSKDLDAPSSATQATTPVSTVAELALCKGDAARAKPPIPNNPTHIRNVVWRNRRAMCLQHIAQKMGNPQLAGQR